MMIDAAMAINGELKENKEIQILCTINHTNRSSVTAMDHITHQYN